MNDDAIRAPQPNWCLYLIECRNGAWYAGITNDIERRYAMHLAGRLSLIHISEPTRPY